jgi:hypothetical protein
VWRGQFAQVRSCLQDGLNICEKWSSAADLPGPAEPVRTKDPKVSFRKILRSCWFALVYIFVLYM